MRVLFLATYFPKPTNTTMGVWALKEAQQLQRAGADVRVVSFTSWVPRFLGRFGKGAAWANCPRTHDWNGLRVDYPRWPFYQVGLLKKVWWRWPALPLSLAWPFAKRFLNRLMLEWRPDVIYAHHGSVNGYIAARFHKLAGIPFVVKDHDFGEITDYQTMPGRFKVYQKVCSSAAAMTPYSRRMQNQLRSLFPGTTVVVNRFGIDPFPQDLLRVPRPLSLQDKILIASTGIFYERKGLPLLIRAFNKIAVRHPNVFLRISGEGIERSEIERAIAEGSAANRITLLGLQPHQGVLQEMAWCDIFALIGWDEPFGVVFLEAMSAGKPVICANDGGINDVIVSGVHGVTVPPRDLEAAANALDQLISDSTLRRKCGVAAKLLCETDVSSQVTSAKLLDILQAAAEHRTINPAD